MTNCGFSIFFPYFLPFFKISINMADSENTENSVDKQIETNLPENNGNLPTNASSSDILKSNDTAEPSAEEKKTKIDILLKPTGDAPIMKKKKWSVSLTQNVAWIMQFMRQYLKLDPSESLFLYINQAFSPSPDQTLNNLYECFGSDGRLVFHYARSQAWG